MDNTWKNYIYTVCLHMKNVYSFCATRAVLYKILLKKLKINCALKRKKYYYTLDNIFLKDVYN